MKKTLSLLAALAATVLATAQLFPDYSISVETTTWQSIASTGTRLTQVYNTYEESITLPFDLEFGGATVPQGQNVKVSARGRVNLGRYGAYNYAYTHWNSPSDEFAIIPFFVNMVEMPRNTSSVYWLSRDDDRGGQELVVEWNGLRRYGANGDNVCYQLHIHSNGDIAVCYGPMTLQAGYWDTVFTFAVVHNSASDRILTTGSWNTDSSIVLSNPSQIGSTPLMHGTPQEGLLLTLVRPLPPCPHPTHLAVGNVQNDRATLTWTGNGVAGAQYKVQYATADFTPGTFGISTTVVADTSYTLLGLDSDQQYYVYVRSDCGADTSRWESVTFRTPCDELSHNDLPYEQHFETAADAACWRNLGTVAWSSQQNVSGTIIHYANLLNLQSWAIMPPVDYVGDLQVSFRVSSGPVMVGVMDSPYDTATFVPLHECWANAAAWQSYTVRLSRYDGNGKFIAFRAWPNEYGVGGCHIDDVVLDSIRGCIAVENLGVARHNATMADLVWNDYDSVGSYMVTWTDGITADSLVVATQGCTIAGLVPETQYSFSVRILCDSVTAGPDTTIQLTTYPTCMTPIALAIDSVTRTSAFVHWTEVNAVGTYRVVLCSSPSRTDTISIDTVVGDTAIVLNGLPTVRQYRVEVSQLCSGTWTAAAWETFRNDYSCQPPQAVAVDTVLATSVVVSITDSLAADRRLILVAGLHADTLYSSDSIVAISGLLPATGYTLSVENRCSDSTFSDRVSITFATSCSVVTHADLPYVEDFGNTVAGNVSTLSPCWSFCSFAPSNYTGMYRPDAGLYHGASGNSLYVLAQQPDWPFFIALPEVDSLDDLMLNLWVYCNWTGDSKIDFGIMSNPADTTTFQVIDTYIPAVAQRWTEVSVPFRGYGGVGHYPAMRVGVAHGTMGDPFYLDDITLTYNLSCAQPDSLGIGSLSDTSALLTIVPAADADSDAVAYHVVLSSHYGNDTMIATATTVAITGLMPATDYELEVRSECPEGGLTTAAHAMFRTDCGAYRLPYFEDFEYQDDYHLPRCWELMDTLSVEPIVRSTWVTPFSGQRQMIVVLYDSAAHSTFATPWLRPTDAPVALGFMAKASSYRYMVDTMPASLTVAVQGHDTTVVLFSDKVLYTDWTYLEFTSAAGLLHDGGRFVITLMHSADTDRYTTMLELDDVSARTVCMPVADVAVVAVDTVPVGLVAEWHSQGIEPLWQVAVWDAAGHRADTVVAGTTLSLTDGGWLADSTDYWLAVRPLCGIGDTGAWSDTVAFRTPDPCTPGAIDAAGAMHIVVAPNPAVNTLNVSVGASGTIELFDLSGRSYGTWHTDGSIAVDVSRMPRGAWFLKVTTAAGSQVRKVLLL